ncbi:BlaI/MecI/CopY family transcriptional regulator [Mumia sp. zg.B17]|uniref:BlaI/MecI/CopY family transcriptional regulator n=1 Tax=unclassified Mumia TaxID=2621872 RepID=UPI001C6ECB4F|nr:MULTISPECIES: BlaI/MecI/CopY family transcriptional regulator [unclassified Mumia]MBW9205597.1 BlaI/MecI/CopY family transcriptional regulator [Mumia sp. zg.B17]MBW9208402.1 BlaI/MecI/CopY family transcriptional regulator [Mumia sp. zg.B21]MDD9348588.1 BlaI/MecI/CopY family transcriptional regulator [Mumia sp.]
MARLGELEREVMDLLWESATPLTGREVLDLLTPRRDLAYTTVTTILDRLARKRVVDRDRSGRAFTYAPTVGRDELTATLLHEVLASAGDDRTAALVHFAETASNDDARALREALARIEATQPPETPATSS